MKNLTFLPLIAVTFAFIILPSKYAWSQSTPELEIYPGGLVFPRMTTVDRDALTPVLGQFVYNIDKDQLNYYDGTNWQEVVRGSVLTDEDGDTRIEVEESADADTIKMYANGKEVVRIIADSITRERIEIVNARGNTFIGEQAGRSNQGDMIIGSANSFVGAFAGRDNTRGYYNSFFGVASGLNNTIGALNSFYGYNAGRNNQRGDFNSFYGYRSGANNKFGTNNTLIGAHADIAYPLDSLDRAIAIGYNAKVSCNNCAVLGGVGVDAVKVGIGTPSPSEALTINGGNISISPLNPIHVGSITDDETTVLDRAQGIYVSDKYAYVAASGDDGVAILDISDPAHPTHVGSITDDGTIALDGATGIYVSGKYAYVAARDDDGIAILDISDPAYPTHVGSITDDAISALDGATSIHVSGKYAYIASFNDNGVAILDISDPAHPTHIGSITDDATTTLDRAHSIYVSGKYAYVASFGDDGVAILDISDPVHPTHVGSITDDATTALNGASGIYVSGKYAYVTSFLDHGVAILDISDPAHPTHVGSITDDATTVLHGAFSIYVSGKYAYVTSYFDNAVTILDISDPTHPTQIGSITDDDTTTTLRGAIGIHVSGKYAYVASELSDGVAILDISGIDAPTASIGSIASNNLNVSEAAEIGNNLSIGGGLNVGCGGIFSSGDISTSGMLDLNGDILLSAANRKISFIDGTSEKAFINYIGQHLLIQNNDSDGDVNIYSEGGVHFKTGGSNIPILFIKDDAKVGIGTTDPGSRLEVIGDSKFTGLLSVNGTDATLGAGGYAQLGNQLSTNVVLDDNEIMARDNNRASDLFLNRLGGKVVIGNVGIISDKLQVNSTGTGALRVQVDGTTRLRVRDNGSVTMGSNTGVTANTIYVASDYNLGIGDTSPDAELDVEGDIIYTGSITDVSDLRLKENIDSIGDAINKIEQLHGITYNLIGEENRSAGLIAQEVASVLPEAVSDIGDGYLGVDYTQLVALLIEGMKEQQIQIEQLQSIIESLATDK